MHVCKEVLSARTITHTLESPRKRISLPGTRLIIPPTMASPVQSLATHLINQTLNSIALLESLALISAPDAHLIRSKLPLASGPFSNLNPPLALPAQQHDLSPSFGGMTVGPSNSYDQQIRNSQQLPVTSPHPALPQRSRPAPSGVRAKVLWDYSGSVSSLMAVEVACILIRSTRKPMTYRSVRGIWLL